MTKIAKFKVATDLLLEAMHIPQNTDIIEIDVVDRGRTLTFTVRSDDLPDVPEKKPIPLLSPTLTRLKRTVKWDWNIESKDWGDRKASDAKI